MVQRFKAWVNRSFYPASGSRRWLYVLPFGLLGVIFIVLVIGGIYGWDYANSPHFCGYICHTMEPQNTVYLISPHSNVYCTECHIGRGSFGTEISRKTQDLREVYATIFHTYTYPIFANRQRPASITCEKCHRPEAFSGNKLLTIDRFLTDQNNTTYTIYLIMKTGGGSKVQGLGRGIHWHIMNKVQYYITDPLSQNIPFVRVYNDDGTTTDYIDTESGFDPSSIDESQLKTMDCITCHNRVTHDFALPADSVDGAMSRNLISPTIPEIRKKGVEVLTASYTSKEEAMSGIAGLENYYSQYYSEFYASNTDLINSAISELQGIYNQTVFQYQKVDWTTHPNNLGHREYPGCFRCHDGKHMNSKDQAIRLECNLCHSIPVVATSQDFTSKIEISRSPEPSSHLNPNWIILHHGTFDATCSDCHTTSDPGGTSNTSFCSNTICHGTKYKFAGFDAPSIKAILIMQQPPPIPSPTPSPVVGGKPTFDANIQPLLVPCTACHNSSSPSANLDLSSYTGVMKGGKNGAVVIPGDSENSLLVKIQSDKHFRNLSADELALIKQWIDTGALEK